MWETIRGYLTFTRKERFGVLFLLLLISILFVAPYFFRPSVGDPDPVAYEKMKKGIREFDSGTDSSRKAGTYDRYHENKPGMDTRNSGGSDRPVTGALFSFDPNTITEAEWQRLGISERLTQTILHYIEKGGRFRRAEDLRKLYGLRPDDYERLLPFVRIARIPGNRQARSGFYSNTSENQQVAVKKTDSFYRQNALKITASAVYPYRVKKGTITEINMADSADWSRLPGIGEKLASRIVHFRDRLGGFYKADQVAETFGLPDSTFKKIKPFLTLNKPALQLIDINNASKEILQAHPYIRWQIAQGIIEYRRQHGNFQSVDELLQLGQMDPQKFEKMRPYLVVKP